LRETVGLVSIPQWCDCCLKDRNVDDFDVEFQSHNGAIAAQGGHPKMVRLQEVSIPQWCDCCWFEVVNPEPEGFNPTMVRLLLSTRSHHSPNGKLFQSHNGAIAA